MVANCVCIITTAFAAVGRERKKLGLAVLRDTEISKRISEGVDVLIGDEGQLGSTSGQGEKDHNTTVDLEAVEHDTPSGEYAWCL